MFYTKSVTKLGDLTVNSFDADADPGSGILPTLGLGSRMEKIGSGILDPVSGIFIPDPGSWMDPGCLSRIQNPGSEMLIPDPQH